MVVWAAEQGDRKEVGEIQHNLGDLESARLLPFDWGAVLAFEGPFGGVQNPFVQV